jgi:hypothetical protein
LASAIFQALQGSGIAFADVSAADIVSLETEAPKKAVRVRRGDVVAIPRKSGGYTLAVVVARNRFGTALGPLRGSFPFPRVASESRYDASARPTYTDEVAIRNGTWSIVDHVEALLSLFPDEPGIYHAPDLQWPGIQIGEFGSAESPSGSLREISEQEAEEVGLLNGAYRQTCPSDYLQQLLDGRA